MAGFKPAKARLRHVPSWRKYTIRKTDRNAKNGLPAHASAWIIYVDDRAVSLYIDKQNVPDIKVPRPMFGMNFEEVKFAPVNPSYQATDHAAREYR